jgi:hypothetical protein
MSKIKKYEKEFAKKRDFLICEHNAANSKKMQKKVAA